MPPHAQHDPDPQMEPVAECEDLLQAEVLRGLFESQGIEAEIIAADQWMGRTAILGVNSLAGLRVGYAIARPESVERLNKPRADSAEARRILAEAEAGRLALDAESEDDVAHCPECGAFTVSREPVSGPFLIALIATVFVVLWLLLRMVSLLNLLLFLAVLVLCARVLLGGDSWRCDACQHRWRD
ncbi:MAG: hypothetical protein HYV26_07740 [Candidatus Hydrogenedentes bacterium]|nr:hypothetical protein [Candidatus Hydrogenedentota bacterium]